MSEPTPRALFAAKVLRWHFDHPRDGLTVLGCAGNLEAGAVQLPHDLESFDFGGGEQREMLKELAGQLAEAVEVAESYKARDKWIARTAKNVTLDALRNEIESAMPHLNEGERAGHDRIVEGLAARVPDWRNDRSRLSELVDLIHRTLNYPGRVPPAASAEKGEAPDV